MLITAYEFNNTLSLFYYSLGMLGFGLQDIFSRAFYAMQDTTTPMKNAVCWRIT